MATLSAQDSQHRTGASPRAHQFLASRITAMECYICTCLVPALTERQHWRSINTHESKGMKCPQLGTTGSCISHLPPKFISNALSITVHLFFFPPRVEKNLLFNCKNDVCPCALADLCYLAKFTGTFRIMAAAKDAGVTDRPSELLLDCYQSGSSWLWGGCCSSQLQHRTCLQGALCRHSPCQLAHTLP